MNTHAVKLQENKSQPVAKEFAQKQRSGESLFRSVDNRPIAITQRKLQHIANNSPRMKQAAQLQSMAHNYPTPEARKAIQMKQGVNVNDDAGLENEADEMGKKAFEMKTISNGHDTNGFNQSISQLKNVNGITTDVISFKLANDKLNVVEEDHKHSDPIREQEKDYNASLGLPREEYFEEYQFHYKDPETEELKPADNPVKRVVFAAAKVYELIEFLSEQIGEIYNPNDVAGDAKVINQIEETLENMADVEHILTNENIGLEDEDFERIRDDIEDCAYLAGFAIGNLQRKLAGHARPNVSQFKELTVLLKQYNEKMHLGVGDLAGRANFLLTGEFPAQELDQWFRGLDPGTLVSATSMNRSAEFYTAAQAEYKTPAVWKVGYVHFAEMEMQAAKDPAKYHSEPRDSYDEEVQKFILSKSK
ncbi:hypothetical protein FHW36_11451 [Chitinophaga polysaccharea]|uniref:Uncharacterized protein n=1 Tax=Chitinophaga polysaccharea TaxID=1293035 RepID=A0A561P3L0_9BACT|nr:hypothetical protein [Chitinophaga polysaccharea]TWF32674.1 hypothetical protein FHW36_11451 [Chitinophaga polysaccharea]